MSASKQFYELKPIVNKLVNKTRFTILSDIDSMELTFESFISNNAEWKTLLETILEMKDYDNTVTTFDKIMNALNYRYLSANENSGITSIFADSHISKRYFIFRCIPEDYNTAAQPPVYSVENADVYLEDSCTSELVVLTTTPPDFRYDATCSAAISSCNDTKRRPAHRVLTEEQLSIRESARQERYIAARHKMRITKIAELYDLLTALNEIEHLRPTYSGPYSTFKSFEIKAIRLDGDSHIVADIRD